ncbi:DUF2975 domain-containing protein [Kibdelosporangium aridum]|uniref:DUF2975 domain-containing protein n=1 Tax=Kibdelosporangium aridum TaxID=2030 RepID=A0A428ZRJ6_KIBAR|nr:DUF2975 domain-containing protein [Kibdelosporangium aridum]RSM90677.1 DUF2975 domain-containing protein [Kibdelosporangium aridum]
MITLRRAVAPLRVLLVLLFGLMVTLETVSLPGQFAHMALVSPENAYLRWPLTAVAVFWVVCAQVVIVCIWQLLTLVKRDRIFTDAAMVWVNVILWAIGAGWVVLVGVVGVVFFNADDPGTGVVLALVMAAVSVFVLLVVVLRALLQQATTLRSDMEAVI